jgi:diacylglycerol kinase (ATP)
MSRNRSVLVVFNPVAGWRRRQRFARFVDALQATDCRVTVRETTARGDAERFAREASPTDFDVIAVAGGDGTVNEVVNGLAHSTLTLAIVPLGTANVMANELGLPATMEGCAKVIAEGRHQRVRVGALNGRRFVMMAGVGFDAHVVNGVTPALKRRFGKLAYVWRSLVGIARYRLADYEIVVDGKNHRAASAIVAKGHFYGGTFSIAPDARLADPWFYVCLFKNGGGWNALRYSAGLVLGNLASYPDVEIIKAHEIHIAGGAAEPVQVDGDIIGGLPVVAKIAAEALSVLVPKLPVAAE